MATNALAPAPKNALSRSRYNFREDLQQDILRQAAEYPQYGELVDYLSARRMMPPIEPVIMSGGEFITNSAFGKSLPKTGIVRIGYSPKETKRAPNLVVHELTHAADRQMDWQYGELLKKDSLTPEEQQFKQAYEKLVFRQGQMFGERPASLRRQTAERIAPEWVKKESGYRSTGSELAAFGMGSAVSPNTGNPAPLHIDPSYATEFSILMGLARRAQRPIPGR